MQNLGITAFFAGIFLIAFIPLTIQVGLKRIETGIFFADGGNTALARRRAAHSNFIEHVPIFLIGLALAQSGGAPAWLALGAGALMLAGRATHAGCLLFTDGTGNARAVGMVLTLLAHLVVGGFACWIGFAALATILGL